jgi:DNA-directed RNA polymerase specialized sigma24 family protein
MSQRHPSSHWGAAASEVAPASAAASARTPEQEIAPEDLLAATFARYRERAVAYCTAILRDPVLAEDAVQSAVVDLLRRIQAGDADFFREDPWKSLKRSLRWAASKQRRGQGAQSRGIAGMESTPPVVEDPCALAEARLMADTILREVPGGMREVLHMRLLDDQSDAVSASRMGISIDAFRCRYKRAIGAARSAARTLGVESAGAAVVVRLRRRALQLRHGSEILVRRFADQTAACTALFGSQASTIVATMAAMTAVGAPAVAAGLASVSPAPALPRVQTSGAPVARVEPGNNGASVPHVQEHHATAAAPAIPVLALPARMTAEQETPEDTQFQSVTASRDDPRTMVAYGQGQSCSCAVLFETRDGGASWRAASGPSPLGWGGVVKVVLPPSYPRDPRLFLTGVRGQSVSLMAPRLGDPFRPVAAPPGEVILRQSFGPVDSRVYVWAGGLLWTADLAGGAARPVTFGAPISGIDAVAAVPSGARFDLLVVAEVPYVQPGTLEFGVAGRPGLFTCNGVDPCSLVSTPSAAGVYAISVSPRFSTDHTIVLAAAQSIWISRDAGRSFEQRTLSSDRIVHDITVVTDDTASGPAVLATGYRPNAQLLALELMALDGSGWRELTPPMGAIDGVDAGGHVVVAEATGLGLVCTVDGGTHWGRRCPAS